MKILSIDKVAQLIILYCYREGLFISHLKLQKLLYYLQAWHLVYFDNPLFEETPEAWVNGPVYRKIYENYSNKSRTEEIDCPEGVSFDSIFNELDDNQKKLFANVMTAYAVLSQEKLVLLTHNEKPWIEARKDRQLFEYCNDVIAHENMKDFYQHFLKK